MSESKHACEGKHGDVEELSQGLGNIVVVENENRRVKAVSHFPKEVGQVCKDIASYFKASAPDIDSTRDNLVSSLSGPEALRSLLMAIEETGEDETTIWFYEYKLLDAATIRDMGEIGRDGLVPFAENIDGELLACGKHEHKGGVFYTSADGDVEGDQIAVCMATFLESYRDDLLSHRLEYIEDCGMVERTDAGGPGSPTPKK